MPSNPVGLVAVLTTKSFNTNNQILTYRVSPVISNVRFLFQNIGSLLDDVCKNCYLKLRIGSSSEENPESWRTFLFLSAPYHILVVVSHASILIAYNAGCMILHDCCSYISAFASGSFWDF